MSDSHRSTAKQRNAPFVVWASLWLVGGSFAFVLLIRDLKGTALSYLVGRDFMNLWAAGKLALDGRGNWVFDLDTFRLGIAEYLHIPTSLQVYSYPPHMLFLDAALALPPYYVALVVWSVFSAGFFVWAAKPYLPKGFPAALAALTPAGCINLWSGQDGLLIGGLWLLFFRWCETRPIRAGAVAAIMTIKPHLGLAIAYTALRNGRVLLSAVIASLALIMLSALVFGADTWAAFLFKMSGVHADLLSGRGSDFYFRMMPSAYVTWQRGTLAIAAQIAATFATAALFWRYRRWDAFIAGTATFIVIPYSLNYDLTVVCLGAIILIYRQWDNLRLVQKLVLGAAFLSPNLTFVWPIAWTVPLALLGCLQIQLEFADEEATKGERDPTSNPDWSAGSSASQRRTSP